MSWNWIRGLFDSKPSASRKQRNARAPRSFARFKPAIDVLEDRAVPAVSIVSGTNGADGSVSFPGASAPADSMAAIGPATILETYNDGAILRSKNSITTSVLSAAASGATEVTSTFPIDPAGANAVGNLVTITTTVPNGVNVGEAVTIAGVPVAGYNGTFLVSAVLSPTDFQYRALIAPAMPSGGGTASQTIATINTATPHGLLVGQFASISGMPGYNGLFKVKAVLSATSFTYVNTTPGLPASGGGTVSRTLDAIDMSNGSSPLFQHTTVGSVFSHPFVVYDDNSGRFIFGEIETDNLAFESHVLFAISNDSTPTDLSAGSFSEFHTVSLTEISTGPVNGTLFASDVNVGFNNDAFFFTFDMQSFTTNIYDHTQLLVVKKDTLLDSNNATFVHLAGSGDGGPPDASLDIGQQNFGMVPARMHDAPVGSPMYFVSTFGQRGEGNKDTNGNWVYSSTAIIVTKLVNYIAPIPGQLSPNPGYIQTVLAVPNFGSSSDPLRPGVVPADIFPLMVQPGNSGLGATLRGNDTRITSVAWSGGHLVAAQTGVVFNEAVARWYEVDTTQTTPKLIQSGNADQTPSVYTYSAAIDIGKNLDIGFTYMESSSVEFPSMYVTGRTQADPKGTMQPAIRVQKGAQTLGPEIPLQGVPLLPIAMSSVGVVATTANTVAGGGTPNSAKAIHPPAIFLGNALPVHVIDGSGITPAPGAGPRVGSHTNTWPNTMWWTNNFISTGTEFTVLSFDFGSIVSLNSAHIWNFNDPVAGLDNGAKDVVIESSTGNGIWTPIQTSRFPQASGFTSYGGFDLFFTAPIATRFLRFRFLNSWGGAAVGLSEVQFYQSATFLAANRAPDYSSIQVDPLSPNSFVADNVYAKATTGAVQNFGTFLSTFRVANPMTPMVQITYPARWTALPGGQFTGQLTLTNTGPTFTTTNSQLFLIWTLPPGVVVTSPGGTQTGNVYRLPMNQVFTRNSPIKITFTLTNPLKSMLPTGPAGLNPTLGA
jgi:hypothetical protein